MTADECHIGLFDIATCQRVIEVCGRRDEEEAGESE